MIRRLLHWLDRVLPAKRVGRRAVETPKHINCHCSITVPHDALYVDRLETDENGNIRPGAVVYWRNVDESDS